MKSLDSKINKILHNYIHERDYINKDDSDTSGFKKVKKKAREELKLLLIETMFECVGEDENHMSKGVGFPVFYENDTQRVRNELRAQIREKIKKL